MWNMLTKKRVIQLSNDDKCRKWENRPFVHHWPEPNVPVQADTNKPKKKFKRTRTAFTTMQINFLEKVFNRFKYVDSKLRERISSFLKISDKTVKVWFQNRRMREKKESSEASNSSPEVPHASIPQDLNLPYDYMNYLNAPYQNSFDIQNAMNYNNNAAYNNPEIVSNHSSVENRNSIYSFESESTENNENYCIGSPIKIGMDFVQDICMQTEPATIQQSSNYTGMVIPKNEPGSVLQEAQNVLLGIDQEATNIPPAYHPNEQYFTPNPENTNMYENFYNYNNYYENLYQYPDNVNNDATYFNFN